MSIESDPLFDVLPVGSTYFYVWRVKQFDLVPVPKEEFGKFYKGDCYIVICCSDSPAGGHSEMVSKKLEDGKGFIHIHFWIGSESTADEGGVAAIKTVQLDDYLGGYPVQHREAEGYESKQFLSYFRGGIRLMKGGFASGFNKVSHELKPALFQIKGKKRPLVHELEEISWKQINNGDVFLLVVPKYIFIWTGKNSNRMERTAAIRVANELKTEFDRFKLSVVILDDGQEVAQTSGPEHDAFDKYLPLAKKETEIQHFPEEFDWIASDKKFEEYERDFVKLYHCYEGPDQIDIKWLKAGPLTRADLDSNDTFIVDNGMDGLWVWVGSKATKKERSHALKFAMEMIKNKKYPANTQVTKVIENSESVEFKSLFQSWQLSATEQKVQARLYRVSRNGDFEQTVQAFEQQDLEEDSVMLIDSVDKIYIWISNAFAEKFSDVNQLDKIVQRFLGLDKTGRKFQPNQIIKVRQGAEPNDFKSLFPQWK